MSVNMSSKPIPGTVWVFHPKQELVIRIEPWLGQLLRIPSRQWESTEVTVERNYKNEVQFVGKSGRSINFRKDGFSVVRMVKEGIVYKPAPSTYAPPKPQVPARIYVLGEQLVAQFPYDDTLREKVKKIGAAWHRPDKTWRWDANPVHVKNIATKLADDFDLSDEKFQTLLARADSEIAQMKARIAKINAIKQADPATLMPPPAGLKTKLWPHQLIAFNYAMNLNGTGFFMQMATGKSLSAIATMIARGVKRILVAAPAKMVEGWELELERHCGIEIVICSLEAKVGSMRKRVEIAKQMMAEAALRNVPIVVIVSHASVVRAPFGPKFSEMENKENGKKKKMNIIAQGNEGWALAEDGANFDMVICDEAHVLGNHNTSISRMFYRFGQRTPYRLALSGTPTQNDPLQFYGVMRFINPAVFPMSYTEFRDRYAIIDDYNRVKQYLNSDELNELVFQQAYRVLTDDVLKLPPMVHTARYYTLTDDERRIYDEMKKNMVATLKNGESLTATNVLHRTLRLSQIVNGSIENKETGEVTIVGTSRFELLKETIDELPAGAPFVVFTRFIVDTEGIIKMLQERGLRVAEVSGRKSQWTAFQRGEFDCIVVQIRSGGAGVDLTRASYAIYYSKDFGWGNYEQTMYRLHRPGQKNTTTYISLIARNTIDEKLEVVLAQKGNLINEMMRQRTVDIETTDVQEETGEIASETA